MPIDLNEIAAKAQFSKYYFIKLFSRYYGRTPYQYLREKRLEIAKDKIRLGLSVTEACFAVGFTSLPSFSAAFLKAFGKSPSEYKKQFSISPSPKN
jgi:AraC-like DNA-binding protein